MTIKQRQYHCPVCGNVENHSTNHEGEIYSPCKKCGNGALYCSEVDAHADEPCITATLHSYHYSIDQPADSVHYSALKVRLREKGYSLFACHEKVQTMLAIEAHDGSTVRLFNPAQFNDQFVSSVGRVHYWKEAVFPNRNMRMGYWLEFEESTLAALREELKTTLVCRYCGNRDLSFTVSVEQVLFCSNCLDSEYLKEDDFTLLRMTSVSERDNPSIPLTDAEKAKLAALYTDAQIHGTSERGKARIKAQRERIHAKADNAIENASRERDGLLWLLDRGISIDNVIYYDHRQMFSFGWKNKLTDAIKAGLTEALASFPYTYELK